jgi:hypothetical protein
VRLGKITPVTVKSYREKRLSQGVTARTVNIETVTFYAVLKFAVDRGMIQSFSRVKQLRQKPPPKRPLSPQMTLSGSCATAYRTRQRMPTC